MKPHPVLATFALSGAVLLGIAACSDDDGGRDESSEEAQERETTGPPIEELDGQQLYVTSCSACHQPGGEGIEGVYPNLADSAFVSIDDPLPVAETVVHGRAGMPAWDGSLTDTEIAAILTYLRTELNDADPVDPEVVTEARERAPLEDEPRDEDDSGNQEEQGQ